MMSREWGFIEYAAFLFAGYLIGGAYPGFMHFMGTHQTLSAAFLAFLGTGVGGYLIGLQILQKEEHRRREKSELRRSIAAVIFVEVDDIYTRLKKTVHNMKKTKFSRVTCSIEAEMYNIYKDKLGLLESEQAYRVIRFYQSLTMLKSRIKYMDENYDKGTPENPTKEMTDSEIRFYASSEITFEWANAVRKILAKEASLQNRAKNTDNQLEEFIKQN